MAKKKTASTKRAGATRARSAAAKSKSKSKSGSEKKTPPVKKAETKRKSASARAAVTKPKPRASKKPSRATPPRPAAPARSAPRESETWDEPVPAELMEEIASQASRGEALLFGGDRAPRKPKAVVEAILHHVDDVNAKRKPGGSELPLMLACAWGERVREALGYTWAKVFWDGGSSIGLVPPDRRFAIYPFPYLKRMLGGAGVDNTVLLFFNMLVAGNVPDAPPRSYVSLG